MQFSRFRWDDDIILHKKNIAALAWHMAAADRCQTTIKIFFIAIPVTGVSLI